MDGIKGLFAGLRTSASGSAAQRVRLNTIAENIAQAEVTKSPDGSGPYRRKLVYLEPISKRGDDGRMTTDGVRVSKIVQDTSTPFEVVHDPSHPDADAEGNVLFPNVNTTKEMADMILAMRAYEANLNASDMFVRMAERALRIAQ
ncbi:MAG: flagellar basal body rod protein FlgC [Planctomycetota bacterium]